MALRRQNLSPSANLLRNSRLFALPNPLPRPQVTEAVGAGTLRASDTATLPYPTHQAIATTKASLARGDWGLKRPLPARSRIVQQSDPVVRVTQLDTIEQVTDYDSATDHVRTRQKFDELGIPMMKGMAAMRDTGSSLAPDGAFESRADITSYESDDALDQAGLILETIKKSVLENTRAARASKKSKDSDPNAPTRFVPFALPVEPAGPPVRRWKHDGPWLPGMSAEDFTAYLSKEIAPRRAEFMRYVEAYVKNEIFTENSKLEKAPLPLDEAEAATEHAARLKKWSTISPEQVRAGIAKLRRDAALNPLNSALVSRLIVPFLRLPTIRLKNTTFAEDASRHEVEQYRFDDAAAPLSTHPSAGLGYLRTNAVVPNHPLLGPQAERAPVKARIVQPRVTAGRANPTARLGVAGFVTNDPERSTGPAHNDTQRYYRNQFAAKNVDSIDVDTHGGAKIEVLPRFAAVTNDGRVHVKVVRSVGAEVNVARGELEDRAPGRERPVERERERETVGAERRGVEAREGVTVKGVEEARMAEAMIREYTKEAVGRREKE